MNRRQHQKIKNEAQKIFQKYRGRPLLPDEATEVLWRLFFVYDSEPKIGENLETNILKNFFMLGFSCGWRLRRYAKKPAFTFN